MDATAAAEDKPKDAAAAEDKPKDAPPPPPPEEVEMRVYMHCEGCARKVKKILKRFDGVEDVVADSKSHKVVVKGKKAAADPMRVVERVQKKTGRKVELLSPIPPPTPPEEKKAEEEPEPPKPEEKKEVNPDRTTTNETKPPVIAVVLKVHMHCEACAQGIRKRILKMKGVQSAEPDLKASEVAVKGVFEESKLAEYVYKRTGKHAAVVKSEPVPAPPPESGAGDNTGAKEEEKGQEEEKEKEGGGDGGGEEKKKEGGKEEEKKDGEKQEEEKEGGGGGEKVEEKEGRLLRAASGVRLPAGVPGAGVRGVRAAAPPAHGAADLQRREPQRMLRHV
ncbi:hypothetical protein ZEAMMB73_Zm00001d003945, partial [Zea mays]